LAVTANGASPQCVASSKMCRTTLAERCVLQVHFTSNTCCVDDHSIVPAYRRLGIFCDSRASLLMLCALQRLGSELKLATMTLTPSSTMRSNASSRRFFFNTVNFIIKILMLHANGVCVLHELPLVSRSFRFNSPISSGNGIASPHASITWCVLGVDHKTHGPGQDKHLY